MKTMFELFGTNHPGEVAQRVFDSLDSTERERALAQRILDLEDEVADYTETYGGGI